MGDDTLINLSPSNCRQLMEAVCPFRTFWEYFWFSQFCSIWNLCFQVRSYTRSEVYFIFKPVPGSFHLFKNIDLHTWSLPTSLEIVRNIQSTRITCSRFCKPKQQYLLLSRWGNQRYGKRFSQEWTRTWILFHYLFDISSENSQTHSE